MDLVSIVIPVFNTGKYLAECIDSVLNQTYKNVEVILVDNASDDQQTLDILADYERKYSNVVVIRHKENLGISVSRNDGVAVAKGKYLSFMDSDDLFEPDFIEACVKAIKENNISCVIGVIDSFRDGDPSKKTEFFLKHDFEFNKIYTAKELFKNFKVLFDPLMTLACVFDLEKYRKFNIYFEPGRMYEDVDWCVKLLLSYDEVMFIDNKGYRRRLRKDSTLVTMSDKHLRDHILSDYRVYELVKNLDNFQQDKEYFTKFYIETCFPDLKLDSSPESRKKHIKLFFEYLKKMNLEMIPVNRGQWLKNKLLYKFYKLIKDIETKEVYKKRYQMIDIAIKYSINPKDYM